LVLVVLAVEAQAVRVVAVTITILMLQTAVKARLSPRTTAQLQVAVADTVASTLAGEALELLVVLVVVGFLLQS
tara:strand:+ start:232 stop:453 length:222 start_codon:yes stop_codon:yes gene_type:complete